MYTDIETLYKIFKNSTSVFTDSRFTIENGLFFALKGAKFDGSEFIEETLSKGAYAAVTDNNCFVSSFSNRVFYVQDVLHSLQQLAAYHRKRFHLPVIAVTGSNGKTTTKELTAKLLSKKYKTLSTQGNLNNHIGLPLTVLKLRASYELAVIEMGASYRGEIKMLCNIAQPTFGYITNFGSAHLEGFGSKEGVVRAKTELYDYLKTHKKKAFVCADDPLQMEKSEGLSRCFFSKTQNADLKIELLNEGSQGVCLAFKKTTIQTHLMGIHNFANLSAAIAIADYFKVSVEDIKTVLENYYPNDNRSQYIKKGSSHIFLDAYNANPTSMEAAIAHFERFQGNKIAILGEMLELGVYSYEAHLQIVKRLQNTDLVEVFLVGAEFLKVNIQEDRIRCFSDRRALEDFFRKHPLSADYFLIKGSRKSALEQLVAFI